MRLFISQAKPLPADKLPTSTASKENALQNIMTDVKINQGKEDKVRTQG